MTLHARIERFDYDAQRLDTRRGFDLMTRRLTDQDGNRGTWAIGSKGSALLLSHWVDRDAERAAEAAEPKAQGPIDLNSIYPAQRRGYKVLGASGDLGQLAQRGSTYTEQTPKT